MRNAVTLCFLLILAGCASIPLKTMATFSQFNEQTLAQLDPAQIRVRVSLRNDFDLKPNSTQLELNLQPDNVNRSTQVTLSLKPLNRIEEQRSKGIFSSKVDVVTYQFAVDQAGAEALKQAQKQFIQANHKAEFSFSVGTGFIPKDDANVVDEILLWVDVKLFENDDYVPLFDAATLKLERK